MEMPFFDLEKSVRRAERRLEGRATRSRSDAGASRLAPAVAEHLRSLLLGENRPTVREIMRKIGAFCEEGGLRSPSRATVYAFMAKVRAHDYEVRTLPEDVASALYNLDPDGSLPGHQLAFYCFNYGTLAAVMYASGLPWLDLYQAARLRGWRPKSRGLLQAVLAVRGI